MLRRMLLVVLSCSLSLFAQDARFQRKVIPIVDQDQINSIVAIGDLNGDGVPDVVSIEIVGVDSTHELGILLSNGNASFNSTPAHVPVAFDFDPSRVFIADINNDGHPDIIGCDNTNVYVFLNAGHGTFGTPLVQNVDGQFQDVADFNNDGKKDIIISSNAEGTPGGVYLGNGNGTFNPTPIPFSGDAFSTLRAADFDGDGNVDLVQFHPNDTPEGPIPDITFFYGDGTGHFGSAVDVGYFRQATIVSLADLNKDGRADLLFTYNTHPGYPKPDVNENGIIYGNTTRTPSVQSYERGFHWYSVAPTGDFDNDGDIDIASNDYAISYRDSSGNYGPPSVYFNGTFGDVGWAGDFNNDGKSDLVVADYDAQGFVYQLELFLNTSAGSGCVPPDAPGMTVCEPDNGGTVDSPVRLRATAKLHAPVYRFEVWVNNTKIYTGRDTDSIDANVNMAPGTYDATFIARTATGERVQQLVHFTVESTTQNCQRPSTAGIAICEPQAFQDVTSPFRVHAIANTGGSPTYRFELWWTSTKLATIRDSDIMDVHVSLAPGTKLLHFIARRADGTRFTKDLYVNVH